MPVQIILNIIIFFSIYLLIAHSFSIVYNTSKYFNLLHAANLVLAPYLLFLFYKNFEISLTFSVLISVLLTSAFSFIIYEYILVKLKKRGANNLVFLIATLGLYIIIEGVISIVFGTEKKILRSYYNDNPIQIADGYITQINLWLICSGILLFLVTNIVINNTPFGLKIKAIMDNEDLSQVYGIKSSSVQLVAFLIGTLLACIAGILIAFNLDLTPTLGFSIFLYGIVAMIIGGIGSTLGLLIGSLLLATAQHLGAYYIDSKWMDAIAYIILILFLIWKPLGFSGNRLKKVEI